MIILDIGTWYNLFGLNCQKRDKKISTSTFEMSYARSLGGAGVGDPSSGLGGSSSTYSSSTCSLEGELEEA